MVSEGAHRHLILDDDAIFSDEVTRSTGGFGSEPRRTASYLDLHVDKRYGRSPHHVVEAVFKGLARALRLAVEIDPRVEGLPTVKGAL